MIKVNVYDFDNKKTAVKLPIKSREEIEAIFIVVLSGDETGFFKIKGGDSVYFDSSDCRHIGYFDGAYLVMDPEAINQWIDFPVSSDETISYERARKFGSHS